MVLRDKNEHPEVMTMVDTGKKAIISWIKVPSELDDNVINIIVDSSIGVFVLSNYFESIFFSEGIKSCYILVVI